jgi:polysaccharide export outer membrane protein
MPEVEDVEVTDAEVSEENPEDNKKRGFFSRIFSKNKDGGQPTITRVGDTFEEELDEEGQLIIRDQPRDNVYRLRIGDALMITLSGSAGLNEQIETLIDDEGTIKLRFIGSVNAKGLSSTELEREIELEYTDRQKIYKELTVRVHVPNTFYFIKGEIRQPGRFPVVGRVTLSQAIAAAGNFTEWADLQDIVLVRNNENVIINYKKIRRNPNLDVELLAGDTITVGRSTF